MAWARGVGVRRRASPVQKHFGGPLVSSRAPRPRSTLALLAVFAPNPSSRRCWTVASCAAKVDEADQTSPQDYHADHGDPGVEEELTPESAVRRLSPDRIETGSRPSRRVSRRGTVRLL